MLSHMTTIELDLERTIQAPIEAVFARLVDIEGTNEWMSGTGTMLKQTRMTSPGPPAVGSTYVDDTSRGEIQGEIAELEAPRRVVFHWWEKSGSGKTKYEGWPGYDLEPSGEGATLVRHHAELTMYGVWRLAAPIFKMLVRRERTTTMDALQASFEPG